MDLIRQLPRLLVNSLESKMFRILAVLFLTITLLSSCGVESTIHLVSDDPACVTESEEGIISVICSDGTFITVEQENTVIEVIHEEGAKDTPPDDEVDEPDDDAEACKKHHKKKKDKFCAKHPWHKFCD